MSANAVSPRHRVAFRFKILGLAVCRDRLCDVY